MPVSRIEGLQDKEDDLSEKILLKSVSLLYGIEPVGKTQDEINEVIEEKSVPGVAIVMEFSFVEDGSSAELGGELYHVVLASPGCVPSGPEGMTELVSFIAESLGDVLGKKLHPASTKELREFRELERKIVMAEFAEAVRRDARDPLGVGQPSKPLLN